MNKTALNDAHIAANAKMVEFAGYSMPIYYGLGILKEHMWTRENAGLFDVSHMGQALLEGADAIAMLEKITPSNFVSLALNKAKYTVLLNDNKCIIDDLIITKLAEDKFFIVYNAGCKDKDEAFFNANLPANCKFTPLRDRSLIAIQGPAAVEIATIVFPAANLFEQGYMTFNKSSFAGQEVFISRLGYTGEDGFEISVPNSVAVQLWEALLKNQLAQPIGLGARDTLRLEMGYPLYGHDIDEKTTPIEADLTWVVAKANRDNFPAPTKKRVGFEILGRGVIREGAKVFALDGKEIGVITSGGFGPTVGNSIAQGYVAPEFATIGTEVEIELRGSKVPAKICSYTYVAAKTKK
jgi:aminomethyltransferase